MSSAGKNVLIVDDNPTNRKLLREFLRGNGYLTFEAEDGISALSIVAHEPVDIIVSDVLMPNMDGYSLCSEVRRRPELKNLLFVLYTATDFTANDEKLGLGLGADRFISKKGSPSAILKTIEEAMAERKVRHSGSRAIRNVLPPEKEMKQYDALLIGQLEENSIELERARLELRSRTDELDAKNAALESRTEELARSNADLEQFAYAASHDLQEPLRAVAGCIQLFDRKYRAGKLNQGGDELVRMIVDGTVRMKALIDGLLAYSRAGLIEKIEIIDAGAVLEEVLANLRFVIDEAKAEVVVGELPSLRFVKAQFGQVFQNLIGNAIKYRRGVDPKICVLAERGTDAWVFSVADNGIGFEQQYAQQIFGVFQRLHTRDQYAGTGIGLAIGKRIVERRGGKIWAESKPNHGSTFYFSVPDNNPALAPPRPLESVPTA